MNAIDATEEDVMINPKKEVAKFACGFEACHTLAHAVLWTSTASVPIFGVVMNPNWHVASVVVNAVIAIVLGVYAWRPQTHGGEVSQ